MFLKRQWFGLLAMVLVMLVAMFRPLDQFSENYTDQALKNAAVTYASARALNAAISVASGTQVSIGAGASATLAPGQVLDPLNDLIEQFSWIVLMAITSLGIQKFLLIMLSSGLFNLLMAASFAWYGVYLISRKTGRGRQLALKTCIGMVFIRFIMTLSLLGNLAIESHFLDETKQAATQNIEQAGVQLDARLAEHDKATSLEESTQSMLDSFYEAWGAAKEEAIQAKDKIFGVQDKVEELIGDFLELIILFVLQTIVLPVLFIWFGYWGVRNIIESTEQNQSRLGVQSTQT